MQSFPGIEEALRAGKKLEVAAMRAEEGGGWIAQLVRNDGRTFGETHPPQKYMMQAVMLLERTVQKSHRPQFRPSRHADSTALSMLHAINVVMTVWHAEDAYHATLYEREGRIPSMIIDASSAVEALVRSVTIALSSVAAAHEARFLGH